MRIDGVEMMMRMAETVALRSTCDRLNVGAVIERERRVISMGYNGNVAGAPHCRHNAAVAEALGNTPCTTAVHAEANAIAWAARHGMKTDDSVIFTTHQPCIDCAKLIVNAGIKQVYFKHPYRLVEGLELLNRVDWVEVFRVNEEYTAIQMRRY